MPFQKTVGAMPAAGLVGEKTKLGVFEKIKTACVADANVKIGSFVFSGTTDGTVTGVGSSATTMPVGLAIGRTLQPQYANSIASDVMGVPLGQYVQYATSGSYSIVSTTAAVIGNSVYVNGTTGVITTAATGTTSIAETGWVVTDLGGDGSIGSILTIEKGE